ncbi:MULTISPECIES: rhomboid family intramembrane serine protease [unclassified Aureispira]|uniref:rhomboid family intramembrane serine protease n=1 Tax=unclassified Aureispira TaxID=2649989 RepID=UPI0006991BB8|nr:MULTISPECIES: rhomboid family intramembrane serine protease [unclassified Aureispira]WMX13499.1 rhomboid family intramembrane serine protease [Aureispira sp. CCB-E]
MNSLFLQLSNEPALHEAPLTYLILAITIYTSYRYMEDSDEKRRMLFNAYAIDKYNQWYRFFSHGLIHKDWVHLGLNSFVLYMFGGQLEMDLKSTRYFGPLMGPILYLTLYLTGLAMSSVYSFYKHRYSSSYNALGASGAVSSVVFATILLSPLGGIGIIFIPIRIPAFIFGGLYLAYSAYKSKQGNDNIGHDAHYWGSVWGFVFLLIFQPKLLLDFIDQIKLYLSTIF